MKIREIEKKDNPQVEQIIRTCLIEFDANKPGCAWEDPFLGSLFEVYQTDNSKYWVVEAAGKIVGGCGIGPIDTISGVCELQKMYCVKEMRGKGLAKELLALALTFAKEHYQKCYIETFANMEAANCFYLKNDFEPLAKPIIDSDHYACDRWYLRKL